MARGMSALTVRDAADVDDAAVGELLVRAFVDSYARKMPDVVVTDRRKRELRDVAAKRQVARVWVAEREGRVVGTVALWPADSPGCEAWRPGAVDLRHLAVEAGERGKGTAQALLEVAEGWARSAKARAICLHVRQGAVGVARLYVSRGYVRDPSGDLDARPEVFLEGYARPL